MTRRLAQLVRGKVRRGLVDAADGGAHPKCPHDGKRRGRWLLPHRQNRTRSSDLPSGLTTERRVRALRYSLSLCVYVRGCG